MSSRLRLINLGRRFLSVLAVSSLIGLAGGSVVLAGGGSKKTKVVASTSKAAKASKSTKKSDVKKANAPKKNLTQKQQDSTKKAKLPKPPKWPKATEIVLVQNSSANKSNSKVTHPNSTPTKIFKDKTPVVDYKARNRENSKLLAQAIAEAEAQFQTQYAQTHHGAQQTSGGEVCPNCNNQNRTQENSPLTHPEQFSAQSELRKALIMTDLEQKALRFPDGRTIFTAAAGHAGVTPASNQNQLPADFKPLPPGTPQSVYPADLPHSGMPGVFNGHPGSGYSGNSALGIFGPTYGGLGGPMFGQSPFGGPTFGNSPFNNSWQNQNPWQSSWQSQMGNPYGGMGMGYSPLLRMSPFWATPYHF